MTEGFEHIIKRQASDAGRGEGFHFNTGLAATGDRGCYGQFTAGRGAVMNKINGDCCQRQGMAQGDEIGGFFGRRDPSQPSRFEHVAFGYDAALRDYLVARGGRSNVAEAVARRLVMALAPTSTIWVEPSACRCERAAAGSEASITAVSLKMRVENSGVHNKRWQDKR